MKASLRTVFARLRALTRGRRLDDEFDQEVADHLQRLARRYQAQGMSEDEARLAARRQFGGVAILKEDLHERRGILFFETMLRDARYALRSLRKSPLFAVTAILTLALSIGANTAIFTLTNQLLLRSLPVTSPGELVLLDWRGSFIGGSLRGRGTFSYPGYKDIRDASPGILTGLAARYQDEVDVTDHGPADRTAAEIVSGNYFEVLGVTAAIGRTLTTDDDRVPDGEPYAVLSYDYWTSHFGADPSVLNRTIDVNGRPMTVVGVAQRGFTGFSMMSPAGIFIPLMMKNTVTPTWDHMNRRDSVWLRIFGRLAPGVSASAAQAALARPFRLSRERDLDLVGRPADFRARYLRGQLVLTNALQGFNQEQQSFAKPLRILLAMVGILLLIACVNVANLLLSRASARQRELTVRLSLGARRVALLRLIMTESLLVAAAGGALGLALSYWLSSLLIHLMPYDNIDVAIRVAPDWRVLAFTAGISLLAALLFGLTPALEATRSTLAGTLRSEGPSASLSGRQARLRKLLVVAQVTLSLFMLIGAGLFALSLHKVKSMNPGMKIANVLSFSTDPSLHKYSAHRSALFFLDLQKRIQSIPGVVSASASLGPVLANANWLNTVHVEGYEPRHGEEMNPGWNAMMPRFFSTLGVPLVAGRDFSERDIRGGPKVMIVNQTFAKRFVPRGNPVGLHVGFGDSGPLDMEIIGVVDDMKDLDLTTAARPCAYTAVLQEDIPELTVYVQASGSPQSLVPAIRRQISQLDASLPMLNIQTMEARIDETHYLARLFAWISGAFGVAATLLASVGLYGVTAFAVARRRQEIGIRMALGARRANVLQLVMREVVLLTAIGVVTAIPLALGFGRLVESQLFGVRARDPLVIGTAVTLITVVSILAGYLPARRASRMDPVHALRYE